MITRFKQGDFIVLTKEHPNYPNDIAFPVNYIFKQRTEASYLIPEFDARGSTTNGWGCYKRENLKNWRFAKTYEIKAYEKDHFPLNISKIKESIDEFSII